MENERVKVTFNEKEDCVEIKGRKFKLSGEGYYNGRYCFNYKEINGNGGIATIPLWGTGGEALVVTEW